jgi:C4-dicarboxylate-specific signal transduction histidine kinase
MGLLADVTDRKRAEEANRNLAHASRLAMVGEFTALIAHEINQPLGAILNYAEAAEMLLESSQPNLDELRQILLAIRNDDERASHTIQRIRALAQKRDLELQPLSLNDVVSDVVEFVSRDAQVRGVSIHTELEPQLPEIMGDRVHLQQVLLNLVLNGMDAMIETPIAKRRLAIRTSDDCDGSVVLAVEDNGPGIAAEQLANVFQSFFTTKKGGMGLGLCIAQSIIEKHEGRIWAENSAGGGAFFRFTIPIQREPTAS